MSNSFTVYGVGSYPNEIYQSKPVTSFTDYFGNVYNLINTSMMVKNFLRYQKRPTNEIINFLETANYNPIVYYSGNTTITYQTGNVFNNYNNIVFKDSTATTNLNISSLRQNWQNPQEFNLFYVSYDTTPVTLDLTNQVVLTDSILQQYTNNNGIVTFDLDLFCGYILYPQRIFLNPIGMSYVGGYWELSATTKLMASSTAFFNSSSIEIDASDYHRAYLDRKPSLIDLPSSLNSYSLVYNLCASRTRINRYLNQNYNFPFSFILENDGVINPDSTLVAYSAVYLNFAGAPTDIYSSNGIVQLQPDVYKTNNAQKLNSSYIISYNYNTDIQTFQLAQYKSNKSVDLGSSVNCVLSASFDLNNSILNYGLKTNPSQIVSISNANGLNVNYIADCATIKNSFESWQSTFNGFRINATTTQLGNTVSVPTVANNTLVWKTKYPPHFYSYKVSLVTGSPIKYFDSFGLNFYLTTSAINYNPYSINVNLSSFISSDYNALLYDLGTTSKNDLIKFSLTDIESFILPRLSATYGPNNIPYNLSTSYYVPVSDAKFLSIYYPDAPYGEISFSLRSTLCSVAGEMDAFEATNITLAKGGYQPLNPSPLFIEIVDEKSNEITLDASFNNTVTAWPGRDLSDSYISWSYEPSNLDVSIKAINKNGSFIQNIVPNQAYKFNKNSWLINVSNYGPETVYIRLSSLKYNEISQPITTNKNLFDYFASGQFLITPTIDLNNLEKTRTAEFKLQIPFGTKKYDIKPSSTPIYWEWSYDSELNSPLIEAYQGGNSNPHLVSYPHSTNTNAAKMSSIRLEVTPILNDKPIIHTVTLKAYSNVRYPAVTGSYTFTVDDFPSANLFNSDFITTYVGFNDKEIANTRKGINVITRPTYSNFNFNFKSINDNSSVSQRSILWTIKNNDGTTTYSDDQYSYNFTNIPAENEITFSVTGLVQGWPNKHKINTTTYLNIIDQVEFNKPLKFIIYPEYAWLGSKYLTLLNKNNYTLSYRPSAYGNKKSNSQTFYISANKDFFDEYRYINRNDYSTYSTTSSFDLLDISYNNDISLYEKGLSLTLSAFNKQYPEINGSTYWVPNGSVLEQKPFNIVADTIPIDQISTNNFYYSPQIFPYNDLVLDFKVLNTNINLDKSKYVTVSQTISTSPVNTPATIVGGTITYYLSSRFWTVSASAPTVNGTYNLFTLNIGDPYVPLYTGDLGIENFYIYAKPSVIQQIPPSTFMNTNYKGNTDLWNKINL